MFKGSLSTAPPQRVKIQQRETAILMAPVDAQIKLAQKIGADKGYQEYLLGIRNPEIPGWARACPLWVFRGLSPF